MAARQALSALARVLTNQRSTEKRKRTMASHRSEHCRWHTMSAPRQPIVEVELNPRDRNIAPEISLEINSFMTPTLRRQSGVLNVIIFQIYL